MRAGPVQAADPNYGPLWTLCKRSPLAPAREARPRLSPHRLHYPAGSPACASQA